MFNMLVGDIVSTNVERNLTMEGFPENDRLIYLLAIRFSYYKVESTYIYGTDLDYKKSNTLYKFELNKKGYFPW